MKTFDILQLSGLCCHGRTEDFAGPPPDGCFKCGIDTFGATGNGITHFSKNNYIALHDQILRVQKTCVLNSRAKYGEEYAKRAYIRCDSCGQCTRCIHNWYGLATLEAMDILLSVGTQHFHSFHRLCE